MKVYNLSCEHSHCFEGWFSSEEDFNAQCEASLISCPFCDNHAITRLPSAPRLSLSGAQAPQPGVKAGVEGEVLAFLRKVVANTEDVGERFAEEARRMHYNETPLRAIRGVASAREYEALADEGIDVLPLLLPEALKQPLQ